MMGQSLSDDELDYLRELANLAMGNAGASLSQLLDLFIELGVPELRCVKSAQAAEHLEQMLALSDKAVSAVRVGFQDFVSGEALLLYAQSDLQAVSEMMQDDSPYSAGRARSVLLDISGILAAACLNGLADAIKESIIVSAPTVLCQGMHADDLIRLLFTREKTNWQETLIVKISFQTENKSFRSDLLLFFDDASIGALQRKVQAMLSSLLA